MLTELLVENLGPIAAAEIVLQPGSSALTGETGAGKTLLVTAVTLLTGGRAERGIIRDGATEARVEGRFVVGAGDPVVEMLVTHDLIAEPSTRGVGAHIEIVITRTVSRSGSRARVNGRLVPVAVLAELGPLLVEIAGQHEQHRMSSPRSQREVLDAFAGSSEAAADVAASVRELSRIERELDELRATERERLRELDVLRFEIDEIEAADIRVGEIAELTAEATRLENAADLGAALSGAVDDLSGERGADERIATALHAIENATTTDPSLGEPAARLRAAAEEIRDLGAELATRVVEPDPGALAETRDRLGAIAQLRRKYGDDEAEILEYLKRSRTRADELADRSGSIEELETQAAALRSEATERARSLSAVRRTAAPKLERAVASLLAELAMPGATFDVMIEDTELYEGGLDAVSFQIATGPGEKPRPMSKIASGGELSRIALVLHLVEKAPNSERPTHPTMIFDEVDAGVGGAAARAVGESLAKLGRGGAQVLVVTHLPQVAAFADWHYRVQRVDGARRGVSVDRVDGDERVEELSRMLAGLPESERAREHAQELLDLASMGAR